MRRMCERGRVRQKTNEAWRKIDEFFVRNCVRPVIQYKRKAIPFSRYFCGITSKAKQILIHEMSKQKHNGYEKYA